MLEDESLYLRQFVRKRRARMAAVARETKAGVVQRLDLGPLFNVFGGRRLE